MKRAAGTAILVMVALVLCQCDGESVDMHKRPKTYKAPDDTMAFDVKLELTQAALSHVQEIQGSVVVSTAYYGLPTPASMPRANRLHEIELGDERVTVGPTATSVHMTGAFDRAQLPEVVDGMAHVMVSAYTVGPNGAADIGVACRSYRNSVAQAKTSGATVRCDIATPD